MPDYSKRDSSNIFPLTEHKALSTEWYYYHIRCNMSINWEVMKIQCKKFIFPMWRLDLEGSLCYMRPFYWSPKIPPYFNIWNLMLLYLACQDLMENKVWPCVSWILLVIAETSCPTFKPPFFYAVTCLCLCLLLNFSNLYELFGILMLPWTQMSH